VEEFLAAIVASAPSKVCQTRIEKRSVGQNIARIFFGKKSLNGEKMPQIL